MTFSSDRRCLSMRTSMPNTRCACLGGSLCPRRRAPACGEGEGRHRPRRWRRIAPGGQEEWRPEEVRATPGHGGSAAASPELQQRYNALGWGAADAGEALPEHVQRWIVQNGEIYAWKGLGRTPTRSGQHWIITRWTSTLIWGPSCSLTWGRSDQNWHGRTE